MIDPAAADRLANVRAIQGYAFIGTGPTDALPQSKAMGYLPSEDCPF